MACAFATLPRTTPSRPSGPSASPRSSGQARDRDLARERGFLTILERSWFCHAPRRDGSACGSARRAPMPATRAWRGGRRGSHACGAGRGGRARRVREARLTEAARPRQPLNALPWRCPVQPGVERQETQRLAAMDVGRAHDDDHPSGPRRQSSAARPRPSVRPEALVPGLHLQHRPGLRPGVRAGRSRRTSRPSARRPRGPPRARARRATPDRAAAAGVLPVPLREDLRVGEPDVAQPDDPVLPSVGHERLHGQVAVVGVPGIGGPSLEPAGQEGARQRQGRRDVLHPLQRSRPPPYASSPRAGTWPQATARRPTAGRTCGSARRARRAPRTTS